ncbi:MAG: hypothetical protein CVV31_03805, partial [Methanomicrobiales archaeon HGW-Methanomicrobiales-2]
MLLAEQIPWTGLITVFLIIVIIIIFARGVVIVQPYEQGLQIRLGQYMGRMNPGFRWVVPLITVVKKLDLRTEVMDVPRQEVITKDNSPTNVDAIVYVRVIDPEKAFFEVMNYRAATMALAQTSLRGIIGDMELDEVLYNRDVINARLRDNIILIGIGKASWTMAKAASEELKERIVCGAIVTKYRHSGGPLSGIEIFEAGHPLPDSNTLKATERILEITRKAGRYQTILFLVSGGGSALFEKPAP